MKQLQAFKMRDESFAGGQQNDQYEAPSTQVVHVQGQEGVESVSLPNLQQYFTNVPRLGKDYVNFKLAYFDFPINDSLVKTIGTSAVINIYMDTYTGGDVYKSWEDSQEDLKKVYTYNGTNITIDLTTIKSAADLAAQIKLFFLSRAPVEDDYITDTPTFPFFNWFADFIYDDQLQRFVVVYDAPPVIYPLTMELGHHIPPLYALGYPKRFEVRITGSQQGFPGKLLANLFGGYVTDQGWEARYDTRFTQYFSTHYVRHAYPEKYQYVVNGESILGIGTGVPRMCADPLVYIRGAPESNQWSSDGQITDVIAIVPRNRPAGTVAPPQASMCQETFAAKTSMASVRSMTLRFTDATGNLIKVDEDYIIRLAIGFDI